MSKKVIAISIDGLRSDALQLANSSFYESMKQKFAYTLNVTTVMPSITLPCHTSIFHSVTPARHGITVNSYSPFASPLTGLFEHFKNLGFSNAMFYGWEPLRDVSRPDSLKFSIFSDGHAFENNNAFLTEQAIFYAKKHSPDFVFLYLLDTDSAGHDYGWMSKQYLDCVKGALACVEKVFNELGEEYQIVVFADHGGHERSHGTDMKEDLTVPLFINSPLITAGENLGSVSVLDIAPTIAKLMGVKPHSDWEGKSLIKE